MCRNVYKNQEEKKRRENFTRLFVSLVSGGTKTWEQQAAKKINAR